jgi:hypothetical protein
MGNSKVGFTDQAFAQIFEGKYLMEVYSIFQEEHDIFVIIILMYVPCILYSLLSRPTNAQCIYIKIFYIISTTCFTASASSSGSLILLLC